MSILSKSFKKEILTSDEYETLRDMLEEILINYEGTLLLVSHDRDFLDQTVTKILAFEGDGNVQQYVGGYTDYLTYNQKVNEQVSSNKSEKVRRPLTKKIPEIDFDFKNKKKLSYKLEFELKNLPSKIDNIEKEINEQNINYYVEYVVNQLFKANKYFNDQAPWTKKDDSLRLNTIVFVSLELIRKISILLYPIIPDTSLKVLNIFKRKKRAFSPLFFV